MSELADAIDIEGERAVLRYPRRQASHHGGVFESVCGPVMLNGVGR